MDLSTDAHSTDTHSTDDRLTDGYSADDHSTDSESKRSEYRSGRVYVQDLFAGIIRETDTGYLFTYDRDYLKRDHAAAVSLTLPLREEPFSDTVLFPFFDGLIPEGWLLNVVIHNWKIPYADRFGLLLASCRDCIGDVWIEPSQDRT